MSERWRSGEREGWVGGENSNISWVLFRSTFCTQKGALCAPACTSALRMLDFNGWAALLCLFCPLLILPYIFRQGTGGSLHTKTEDIFREGINTEISHFSLSPVA